MEDRIYKIKRQVEAMMDAGVRRTTFYPLIAESLKETEGQPKQIRRARAMEYLLDNVELEVFPMSCWEVQYWGCGLSNLFTASTAICLFKQNNS